MNSKFKHQNLFFFRFHLEGNSGIAAACHVSQVTQVEIENRVEPSQLEMCGYIYIQSWNRVNIEMHHDEMI